MRRTWIAIAALSVLAGCGSRKNKTDEKSAAKPAHPDPLSAVLGCVSALATVDTHPPEKRTGAVLDACKQLYVRPACRRAWSDAANAGPDARTASIVEGCRKAYCPDFKDRGFKICAAQTLPAEFTETLSLWKPLDAAITAKEYGKDAKDRALVLKLRVLQILTPIMIPVTLPRAAPPRPGPEDPVRISLARRKNKVVITLHTEKPRSWTVSDKDRKKTLAALARALPKQAGQKNLGIVLETAPGLPYQLVVDLLDILRAKGFVRLGMKLSLPRPRPRRPARR